MLLNDNKREFIVGDILTIQSNGAYKINCRRPIHLLWNIQDYPDICEYQLFVYIIHTNSNPKLTKPSTFPVTMLAENLTTIEKDETVFRRPSYAMFNSDSCFDGQTIMLVARDREIVTSGKEIEISRQENKARTSCLWKLNCKVLKFGNLLNFRYEFLDGTLALIWLF